MIKVGAPLTKVQLSVTIFQHPSSSSSLAPSSSNPANSSSSIVQFPADLENSLSYLSSVTWASPSLLVVSLTPRNQSSLFVLTCPAPRFSCTILFQDRHSWGIEQGLEPPLFSEKEMVVRAVLRDGAAGRFKHLLRVSLTSGQSSPITLG